MREFRVEEGFLVCDHVLLRWNYSND